MTSNDKVSILAFLFHKQNGNFFMYRKKGSIYSELPVLLQMARIRENLFKTEEVLKEIEENLSVYYNKEK
jgi:hypothetical protein